MKLILFLIISVLVSGCAHFTDISTPNGKFTLMYDKAAGSNILFYGNNLKSFTIPGDHGELKVITSLRVRSSQFIAMRGSSVACPADYFVAIVRPYLQLSLDRVGNCHDEVTFFGNDQIFIAEMQQNNPLYWVYRIADQQYEIWTAEGPIEKSALLAKPQPQPEPPKPASQQQPVVSHPPTTSSSARRNNHVQPAKELPPDPPVDEAVVKDTKPRHAEIKPVGEESKAKEVAVTPVTEHTVPTIKLDQ